MFKFFAYLIFFGRPPRRFGGDAGVGATVGVSVAVGVAVVGAVVVSGVDVAGVDVAGIVSGVDVAEVSETTGAVVAEVVSSNFCFSTQSVAILSTSLFKL